MKRIYIIFMGILLANFAYSQNETDALRYSYLNYNGTARYSGLGGAMGALGADMSAISMNPAGAGRYSRSDFSFTGDVTVARVKATFNGNQAQDLKGNFNISNIGAVFVKPLSIEKPTMWRYYQVGITSSRTNDFHSRTLAEGNNSNSMLDAFSGLLNSEGFDLSSIDNASPFYERLVYDAQLLGYDNTENEFFGWYDPSNPTPIRHVRETVTRGAQYQTDITLSGNYNGKLYVGGSIGFPRIRYNSSTVHTEIFNVDSNIDATYDTKEFSFTEELKTEGNGINAKIGLIYLPVQWLRVGVSLHTPTRYSMNDSYSTAIASRFVADSFDQDFTSDVGGFDYRLITPGRVTASAAFLLKKRGFLTLEYEYVDYGNSTLKEAAAAAAGAYDFDLENSTSESIYRSASIIKAGAEFRVTNNWTVRGGYAFYESPFKEDINSIDASRTNVSGGLGYKNANFSLDFTYLRSATKSQSFMYDPSLVPETNMTTAISNFMVTAGFRF